MKIQKNEVSKRRKSKQKKCVIGKEENQNTKMHGRRKEEENQNTKRHD